MFKLMLVNSLMFNFYRENSFAIKFRVGAGGGGSLDFSVSLVLLNFKHSMTNVSLLCCKFFSCKAQSNVCQFIYLSISQSANPSSLFILDEICCTQEGNYGEEDCDGPIDGGPNDAGCKGDMVC